MLDIHVRRKHDLKDKLLPSASGQNLHHGHGRSVVDSAAADKGGQERENALMQLEAGNEQLFIPYSQLLPDMLCFLKCYLLNSSLG